MKLLRSVGELVHMMYFLQNAKNGEEIKARKSEKKLDTYALKFGTGSRHKTRPKESVASQRFF